LHQLPGRPPSRKWLGRLALSAALLAGLGWGLAVWLRAPQALPIVRFSVTPPEKAAFYFTGDDSGPPAVSPDGRAIVYAARAGDGVWHLWVRRLDMAAAQMVAGTEGGQFPFWSPDSLWVAFFSNYKLRKVPIAGGPVQVICEASESAGSRGGTWNRDGVILFSPHFNRPLYRVSAGGGTADPVTRLDASRRETTHRWPQFLPDGRHFLYFGRTTVGGAEAEKNGIYVGSLDSAEKKFILRGESNAVYVPSGWLLFWRDENLLAQRFDVRRLELLGQPVAVAEGVEYDAVVWRAVFSASDNGVLVYQAGPEKPGSQLVWYDREGRQVGTLGEALPLNDFRLSPDGAKVALEVNDPSSQNEAIWILDAQRGLRTRVSRGPARVVSPAWSPDGSRVAFGMDSGDARDIFVAPAEGGENPEPLLVSPAHKSPSDWSPDGRYIAYVQYSYVEPKGRTKTDTWILPLFGDRKPFPFIQSTLDVWAPRFSSDGKWLAYSVLGGDTGQVFISDFPAAQTQRQVSISGGSLPVWRRDGRELYYLAADNRMMAVNIREVGKGLEIGPPRLLFQPDLARLALPWYDVTPDGRRLLFCVLGPRGNLPLTVVLNWTSELRP